MAHTHPVVDIDSRFVIKFYNKKLFLLTMMDLKSNKNEKGG
jgi:hypothetical protein|nr:MAG TPA: hypothetical protein [Caudoviricetes sp.]